VSQSEAERHLRLGSTAQLIQRRRVWWLQSHVTDVPEQELQARMQDPAMLEAMRYVQQSPADALRS
jgi:hypothetical protein